MLTKSSRPHRLISSISRDFNHVQRFLYVATKKQNQKKQKSAVKRPKARQAGSESSGPVLFQRRREKARGRAGQQLRLRLQLLSGTRPGQPSNKWQRGARSLCRLTAACALLRLVLLCVRWTRATSLCGHSAVFNGDLLSAGRQPSSRVPKFLLAG